MGVPWHLRAPPKRSAPGSENVDATFKKARLTIFIMSLKLYYKPFSTCPWPTKMFIIIIIFFFIIYMHSSYAPKYKNMIHFWLLLKKVGSVVIVFILYINVSKIICICLPWILIFLIPSVINQGCIWKKKYN